MSAPGLLRWDRTAAIAANTFLELVRLKVFYFLLIFALLIIGSSAFLVQFSFQEQFQVLKDVALGAMSIFTWLLAVLATAALLPNDLEDRTLYTILAKPVRRFEYLAGKWLGVLLLLLVAAAVMAAMFAATLYARQEFVIAESLRQADAAAPDAAAEVVRGVKASTFTWSLVPAVIAIYLKAAIFASLTLFISTFATSTIFTVMIAVMAYLIGHIQPIAREYWLAGGGGSAAAKVFLALVALLFPDLQLFNLTDDIVAGNAVALPLFLATAELGLIYLLVYLLLAQLVFAGKEL